MKLCSVFLCKSSLPSLLVRPPKVLYYRVHPVHLVLHRIRGGGGTPFGHRPHLEFGPKGDSHIKKKDTIYFAQFPVLSLPAASGSQQVQEADLFCETSFFARQSRKHSRRLFFSFFCPFSLRRRRRVLPHILCEGKKGVPDRASVVVGKTDGGWACTAQ